MVANLLCLYQSLRLLVMDKSIKKILSAGDLIERMLINTIKLKHFKGNEHKRICLENEDLQKVINDLIPDASIFEEEKKYLFEVLQMQWNILDEVHDLSLDISTRGLLALKAQNMNADRIKYKNGINIKSGYREELKSYGIK